MPSDGSGQRDGGFLTRRGVLAAVTASLLAGCAGDRYRLGGSGSGEFYIPGEGRASGSAGEARRDWQPAPVPSEPREVRVERPAGDFRGVMPRSTWTKQRPIPNKVQSMSGVQRVTVHHEGWTPVYFTDMRETMDRLALIRKVHVKDRGWGDIGYHFVVDRGGRVWEARPLAYQGAHAGPNGANRHNVGVMLLGNFDKQRPSDEQFAALVHLLRWLRGRYRVATRSIYTHQELNPTACPGRVLQAQMVALRKHAELL
ncbi:peptidoglycan recognition protein family protein [Mucisphaera calidilacus]|uniref:N-acetylmuramoyl-L-alanine amidase n=1 Tax=Mucisphaera calidilacus TaxID=2527982 RepID=A0A518BZN5_9BACT|nr:peptidoglycan recognition family protein [Mucisphaera calidilacus]QDU72432.1 N-acetylmuramoyl-L-alanine amidase [Mucisphaera calidilacus]